MKSIRVLSFFLSAVFLLPFASCAVPEENLVPDSPIVENTVTPRAQTPTPTPAPTPSPTPTPEPSFAYDPDNPYAALRAYMDAEIAEAPDAGPAPFEADMLNAIARDLWYSGRFSFFASVQGRSVDYVAYAMEYSKEDYKVVMITDNEDSGLIVTVTLDDRKLNGMQVHVYDELDHERSIATLQERNLEWPGPLFGGNTASPTRAPGERVVYKNTVTVPTAARGEEKPIAKPEMREAMMDKAFAFILERYEVEPGRYAVVAGDYEARLSTNNNDEGCVYANFEMNIRGTTREGKGWETYEYVNFSQDPPPGDSVDGEISLTWIYPRYSWAENAFPKLTPPETDEERVWYEEEVTRRLKEYEDYQWQRLLDQGLYAKEITVE